MNEKVGILRNKESLNYALKEINKIEENIKDVENTSIEHFEIQNMVVLAKLVITSAIMRKESRGAHYRTDYNETCDKEYKLNIIRNIYTDMEEENAWFQYNW